MKKNTKLLLGAGAALGLGYLLLRKGDGSMGALGAAGTFTPEELAEFNEFDSFYATEVGLKNEFNGVVAAIAKLRGRVLTLAEKEASYDAAVAAGMERKGYGALTERCVDACITASYGPYVEAALAALGLSGADDGGSEGSVGECPAGQVPATSVTGEILCVAEGGSSGSSASTYHTRDLGDPCSRSSDCVGALLCRSKKCVAPKSAAGTTAPAGPGVPTTTDPAAGAAAATFKGDTAAKDAEAPAVADGGMSLSSWLLVGGAAAAVWFLLRTDDTKVVRLRAEGAAKAREVGSRAVGAASKKLAEYQRRLANGAGVNGLRRGRKARR